MTDADEIARRAREIGARAEQIADDAGDAEALREELDRLDAELAQLDEEQRRLDEELRDRGEESFGARHRTDRPQWADTIVGLVSDVTERVSALGVGGWPWGARETVERTVAVDGVVPVVINNRAGSIKVRVGESNTVTVSAELFATSSAAIEEMTVAAERQGDEIVVRTDWPDVLPGRRARLTVTVPPGTPVRAKTAGGSVKVRDTHAPATAKTRGGSIDIKGTNGEIDARTGGGSIHVDDHAGPVHAATSGGSVHLDGHLTDTVEATTSGGSIHIGGADGATVVATTSGGSIRVRGRLVGHSRMRTAGGSVTVAIPSDSRVHVNARGNSASSDFVELESRRGRIDGTLGDGSDGTIELRTSGGSVTVSKT